MTKQQYKSLSKELKHLRVFWVVEINSFTIREYHGRIKSLEGDFIIVDEDYYHNTEMKVYCKKLHISKRQNNGNVQS